MSRNSGAPDRPRWGRLRTTRTAVAALLLVVLVLPGLTGGIAFWRSRALIVAQVEDGQNAATDALVEGLSWGLDMATRGAANAAADEGLHAAARRGDLPTIKGHLRSVYRAMPMYRSVAIVDAAGTTIAAWPYPLTTAVDEPAADTSHRVFAGGTAGTDGVIAVRYPVTDGAALVAEISLLAASPQLQTFRFGDTGTATLVDQHGQVLVAGASQRRNQILRAPEVLALARELQPGQLRYYSPLLQRRNISTFEPVPSWQLGVLVDIAEREAFSDLTRLAVLIAVVVMGLVTFGLLGVVVIARRLASSERGLQQAHDAAEQQALTDPLTGLANRRAFDDALLQAVEQARASGTPLAVTMLDLNRFKRLNDTRGHAAGDAALCVVADAIRGAVRSNDLAARLGGDEFALLQIDCTEQDAGRSAARICDAVARRGLLCDSEVGTVLTVSAGTAQLVDGMSADDLVVAADVDLYRSKEQTRLVEQLSETLSDARAH